MVSIIQGTSSSVTGVSFQTQKPTSENEAANGNPGKGSASQVAAEPVGNGSVATVQASSSSTAITGTTSVTNADGSVTTTTTYADGTTSTTTSLPDHTKASYAYEEQQKFESGAAQTQSPGGKAPSGGTSGKTDFLA